MKGTRDHSRKSKKVWVGETLYESLTDAAQKLSLETKHKVYPYSVADAAQTGKKIADQVIRFDKPAPDNKPVSKPRRQRPRPRKGCGKPLLGYPPGESPLERSRVIWR